MFKKINTAMIKQMIDVVISTVEKYTTSIKYVTALMYNSLPIIPSYTRIIPYKITKYKKS